MKEGHHIVVLERGWVYVGKVTQTSADTLRIDDASCVRRWGTTNGLGELAAKGPQRDTKLDPAGVVEAPMRSVLFTIATNPDAWKAAA